MQLLKDQTVGPADNLECATLVMDTVLLGMRTIHKQVHTHCPMDLSVPQFRVLAFLNRRKGASLSDVAAHLGLTLASMSRSIDCLVKRSLVVRTTAPDDRRRVILELTPAGSETFESVRMAARMRFAELLSTLSPEEREAIMQSMRVLQSVLRTGGRCSE